MTSELRHEEFYTSGVFSCASMRVHLGWVAHPGSAADGQPALSRDGRVALIGSGECYCEDDTRIYLQRRGHQVTAGTLQWVVHLYEEKGDECLAELNGLLSGALVDQRLGRVLVFNDRFGLERIYWHEAEDAFFFASEAKALLRVLPNTREFDREGLAHYATYGCTLNWRTLFKDIELLPAGSALLFDESVHPRRQRYFTPEQWSSAPRLPTEAFQERFAETFSRILPRYFEADSRVGISLTGGLDTRAIMACRPETDNQPICYTFAGEEGETRDSKVAAAVASACGLEHRNIRIDKNFFADFADLAEQTVYVTDGCLGLTGAHELYLNRKARELSPVRLTGNCGSELLRGARTLKPMPVSPRLFDPDFRCLATEVADALSRRSASRAGAIFEDVPWSMYGTLLAARSQVGFRTPYLDRDLVQLSYRGHDNQAADARDWLITRASRKLATIPTDRGYLGTGGALRRSWRRGVSELTFKLDYWQNEVLPGVCSILLDPLFAHENAQRRLLGTHKYLHYRAWFRRELRPYLLETLGSHARLNSSVWDSRAVRELVDRHCRGQRNHVQEINLAFTLLHIERLLLKPRGMSAADPATVDVR